MRQTIELTTPTQNTDAYYTNEYVIITFALDEIFPETRKEWPIYAGKENNLLCMKHRNNYLKIKNGEYLDKTFEWYLHEILDSGKIAILYKKQKKFIYEIKKEKWGFSVGMLAGAGGYKYYLPDGTLFFKVKTWVS